MKHNQNIEDMSDKDLNRYIKTIYDNMKATTDEKMLYDLQVEFCYAKREQEFRQNFVPKSVYL